MTSISNYQRTRRALRFLQFLNGDVPEELAPLPPTTYTVSDFSRYTPARRVGAAEARRRGWAVADVTAGWWGIDTVNDCNNLEPEDVALVAAAAAHGHSDYARDACLLCVPDYVTPLLALPLDGAEPFIGHENNANWTHIICVAGREYLAKAPWGSAAHREAMAAQRVAV